MLEAAHEPLPGVGRYSLHGRIAAGGMATVYLGRMSGAVGFTRVVAVKRMLPRFTQDPDFVAMFLDEAALASRVQHPNVVPTLDVVAEQGEVFIVMEYVRGQSLGALLNAAAHTGVPVDIAASIICGVLAGLHAAHEARDKRGESLHIVHRDVSPHNILVGADGVARIMDFGVAKAAKQLHITQEGQLKGKLAYMAPEQIVPQGQIDRGVDVFAAAVVLWGMLAGRPLFRGQNLSDTVTEILSAPIPSLSAMRADVPAALDEVVMKGLSRDRKARWATAQEFESAIEAAVPRIASARVVGAWVERFASEVLAERERQVAAVDSSAVIDAPPPPASVPAQIGGSLAAPANASFADAGATSADTGDTPRLPPRSSPLGAQPARSGDVGIAEPLVVAPLDRAATVGTGVFAPSRQDTPEPGRIRTSPARMALYVGVGVVSMSAVLVAGLWGGAVASPDPAAPGAEVNATAAEPTPPATPVESAESVPPVAPAVAEPAAVDPSPTHPASASATVAVEAPPPSAAVAPPRPTGPRKPPPPKPSTTPTATDPRYFPERP